MTVRENNCSIGSKQIINRNHVELLRAIIGAWVWWQQESRVALVTLENHTHLDIGVTFANNIFVGNVGDFIEVDGQDGHVFLLKDCSVQFHEKKRERGEEKEWTNKQRIHMALANWSLSAEELDEPWGNIDTAIS